MTQPDEQKTVTAEQLEEVRKDVAQIREMEVLCAELRAKHGIPTDYVFPEIGQNIGGHHFQKERGLLWVAVRVTAFDYLGACAFLESYNLQLWMIYRDLHQQASIRGKIAAGVGKLKSAVGMGN